MTRITYSKSGNGHFPLVIGETPARTPLLWIFRLRSSRDTIYWLDPVTVTARLSRIYTQHA